MTKASAPLTLAMPPDGVLARSERLILAVARPEQAPEQLAFELENRQHLEPWEPARPPGYYGEGYWRAVFERDLEELAADRALRLTLFWAEPGRPPGALRYGPVLGGCRFSTFVRGSFHACHLGYRLDHRLEGQGLMREALGAALPFLFETLGFHRVMANYQPTNERSGRLLRKLGFQVEGYARDYLFLAGAWRDHVLTSLTRPEDGGGVRPWQDGAQPRAAATRSATASKTKSRG